MKRTVRCSCGARFPTDARFCSGCGSPQAADAAAPASDPSRDAAPSPDVSFVLGTSTTTAGTEVARRDGLDRRWLSTAAVVVVALLGWSVWSGNGSEPLPVIDLPEPTTTIPERDVPATTVTTFRPLPTSTVPPVEDEVTVRQIGEGGPLLGEETGLFAIVVEQPSILSVLDLDTGVVRSVDTLYTWIEPVMVSGDFLLARVDDALAAFSLLDLEAPPIRLLPDRVLEPFGSSPMFPEPRTDGTAWVVETANGPPTFIRVDLATGAAVDEFVLPPGSLPYTWVRHDVDDDEAVFSSLDAGVYLSDGERHRRVAEGRLLATDDERTLILTCDEELRCRVDWRDRATWSPLDLAVPAYDFDGAAFVGGTDWLHLVRGSSSEEQWLFHVVTGERRLLDADEHLAFEAASPPISPDGRWMASHDGGDLVIVDLTTDVRHEIDGVEGLLGAMVLTAGTPPRTTN